MPWIESDHSQYEKAGKPIWHPGNKTRKSLGKEPGDCSQKQTMAPSILLMSYCHSKVWCALLPLTSLAWSLQLSRLLDCPWIPVPLVICLFPTGPPNRLQSHPTCWACPPPLQLLFPVLRRPPLFSPSMTNNVPLIFKTQSSSLKVCRHYIKQACPFAQQEAVNGWAFLLPSNSQPLSRNSSLSPAAHKASLTELSVGRSSLTLNPSSHKLHSWRKTDFCLSKKQINI